MASGGSVTDFDIKFLIASRGICAVCLETVKDHRMLPCGHVFCVDCLRPIVLGNRIDCPSCKDRRDLVKGSVYFLPKSLLLNDLLEHFCSKCAKKKREVRCEHSQKWFCHGCHKYCPTCTNKAKEALSSKQTFISSHSECLSNIQSVHDTYKSRTLVMCKQICDHAENMVKKIRDGEQKLLEELSDEATEEEGRLLFFKENIKGINQQIKASNAIVSPCAVTHYNNVFEICEEWRHILDNPSWDKSITFNSITFLPEMRSVLDSKFIVGTLVFQSRVPIFHPGNLSDKAFGHWGSGDGEFNCPSHVAVSPESGNFVVVDSGNNRIQVIDSIGQHLFTFGSKGGGEGEFDLDGSSGVAVTSQGLVFVSDTKNDRVQVFTECGEFLMMYGSDGSTEELFCMPSGISYSETCNSLLVCDFQNKRIQVLELDGTIKKSIATEPLHPLDIALCPSGDILVACGLYPRAELRLYDADGRLKDVLARGEQGCDKLDWPCGVTVNMDGHIIVTDTGTDRVHVMDHAGKLIHSFWTSGENGGELSCPVGVACTKDGRVVVVDQDNHRMQLFSFR